MTTRFLTCLMLVSAVVLALLAMFGRQQWIDRKIANARGDRSRLQYSARYPIEKADHSIVLLLGDSRLSRWNTETINTQHTFVNRAVGGETVAQLAKRFEDEITFFQPKIVVLSSGINDILGLSFMRRSEREPAVTNLLETFSRLTELADIRGVSVIVTTVLPPARPTFFRRLVWSSNTIDLIESVNESIRHRRWPRNVQLIDFSKVFQIAGNEYMNSVLSSDTLHLSAMGYRMFSRAVMSSLDGDIAKNNSSVTYRN